MSSTLTGSDAIIFENAFYIGARLQNILYGESNDKFVPYTLTGPLPGIQLVLYFRTMRILLNCGSKHNQSDMFYAVFSSVMLLLITVWIFATATLGQKMWVLNQNYPGGPLAYAEAHVSDIYMNFGTTAGIILQQMTDGLMVRPSAWM